MYPQSMLWGTLGIPLNDVPDQTLGFSFEVMCSGAYLGDLWMMPWGKQRRGGREEQREGRRNTVEKMAGGGGSTNLYSLGQGSEEGR